MLQCEGLPHCANQAHGSMGRDNLRSKRTAMTQKPKMTPAEARKDHREMLRFLALNAALGIFIGLVLTAALLYFNIGDFWTRVQHSSMPAIAVLLVAAPLSLLLGGASMSTAIMMLPYEKKYDE